MAGLSIEWGNPIFYLNAAAMLLLLFSLRRVLRAKDAGTLDGRWALLWIALTLGTALHFVGDLFGLSENVDHVWIHAVLLVAIFVPAYRTLRE